MGLVLSQEAQRQTGFEVLTPVERQFLLMTMMHSGCIQDAFRIFGDTRRFLPLFKQYCDDNTYGFAMYHRDIVAEFGRFSHHNETLKRASTAAEQAL